MAFTPDQPFPKTPGNPIMAKDWNDAIAEVQRLDTAKVNKLVPDTMAGPLTINNALAVGTAAAIPAGTRLQVEDGATPVIARLQSTASFGAARLEMWSDPRNSANEWRPGFIESFDQGSFTGGLRFVTNGTGAAAKTGALEAMRLVNGLAGFGGITPAFRIDSLGPIRSRSSTSPASNSGFWLNQPTGDRAFIGMATDNLVGFMGNAGGGWSLQMDVTNGNLGVRGSPGTNALTVTGTAYVNGNLGVGVASPTSALDALGRLRSRQSGAVSSGLTLFQTTPNADRAIVGMNGDNSVGLFSVPTGVWGLQLDLNTALISVPGSISVSNNVTATRVWSSNVHTEARASNYVTWNGDWSSLPNMSVTFTLTTARPVWVWLHLPNFRVTASATGTFTANVRLLLDGAVFASVTPYFIVNTFASNELNITRITTLAAGTHTISTEWAVGTFSGSPVMHLCETGAGAFGERSLQIIEL